MVSCGEKWIIPAFRDKSSMPRRLASFFLRHFQRAHYRITGTPQRSYRTYTYSEAGGRKLFGRGGILDCPNLLGRTRLQSALLACSARGRFGRGMCAMENE